MRLKDAFGDGPAAVIAADWQSAVAAAASQKQEQQDGEASASGISGDHSAAGETDVERSGGSAEEVRCLVVCGTQTAESPLLQGQAGVTACCWCMKMAAAFQATWRTIERC